MRRPYYLFSNGRLRRRQNTLFLEKATSDRIPDDTPDDDGAASGEPTGERVPFPVEQVESLYCFGEIEINTKLVTFLAQHHIPVHFFDYYGHYTASLCTRPDVVSGRLRVAQVEHYLTPFRRLTLARTFVAAALYNIRRVVRYYLNRSEATEADALQAALITLDAEAARLDDEPGIPELMAAEGRARDAYYQAWPAILGPRLARDFPFDQRTRRPPSNALNAAISFGNSLCYTETLKQIQRTALEPAVSYLHEPGDRRFSLALDLSEVFKPLLVDRTIFRLLKAGQLRPHHFAPHLGGVYLTDAGRKLYVEHWDERLRTTVQHRSLGRHVSYARLIRLDCYRLIRHLMDPDHDPYTGFRMWW